MTSSIFLKNKKNTAGLEWFRPPERNTLRPLCVVLPCLERVCESLLCTPSATLLYLKGGARCTHSDTHRRTLD